MSASITVYTSNDERVHKDVVLDWLCKVRDEYGEHLSMDIVIAIFQEEFDYWPEEAELDLAEAAANDLGAFRKSDPSTSAEAAKVVYPRTGTLRWKVLMNVAAAGSNGVTAHELETHTGILYRSLTPRIGELKRMGFIKTNGQTRLGGMGAEMEVLVLTDAAKRAIEEREGYSL